MKQRGSTLKNTIKIFVMLSGHSKWRFPNKKHPFWQSGLFAVVLRWAQSKLQQTFNSLHIRGSFLIQPDESILGYSSERKKIVIFHGKRTKIFITIRKAIAGFGGCFFRPRYVHRGPCEGDLCISIHFEVDWILDGPLRIIG